MEKVNKNEENESFLFMNKEDLKNLVDEGSMEINDLIKETLQDLSKLI
jgi:hypothetical protein